MSNVECDMPTIIIVIHILLGTREVGGTVPPDDRQAELSCHGRTVVPWVNARTRRDIDGN